jgi:protein-glutamine gamma-glutamyltransferase
MQLPRHHSKKKELAQYILLGLPTIAILSFGILIANEWLPFLQKQTTGQILGFAAGLGLSLYAFARRLRFITLSTIFILSFLLITSASEFFLPGEFEAFFFEARLFPLFFLFSAGWLAGYGFSRSRLITILWATLFLTLSLFIISANAKPERSSILGFAIPLLAYAVYVIYTSELLRNLNEDHSNLSAFFIRRFLGFFMLAGLILFFATQFLKTDFSTIEKEWEQGGQPKENNDRQNSLTRNDGLGTTTQSSMGLGGFNNRSSKDSVLFVAKLDHFFEDEITPNPLYFVSDYFTLFDTLTQTFTSDSLRPQNDLIKPDLLSLPLYFRFQDENVLERSMNTLEVKEVTAEVYKTHLSPRHFTAPSTAFFVQPISVPEENKALYKSAYRTRMMVSELNSAYFVYNPVGDEELAIFQEQRFSALRSIKDFDAAPSSFLAYYTQMPLGPSFDSIRNLAIAITENSGAIFPIDKILSIRDFFVEKDSSGNPQFRYSDNPGIPGIPSANKLCYFLFDSKKGYCAYYAGATLFLLRSLGIPSRIATGFMTVDRSNKNPGWYWFYEDQAHAWVQVWFPDYGWLDFDTTVPDSEAQEAPQPDQTPPLTAQTALWVANGKVITVDTISKRVKMEVSELLYWDKPIELSSPKQVEMDVSLARFLNDTGAVRLSDISPNMDIVAVSFSEQLKAVKPDPNESWQSLIKKWPLPLPVDEIKIMKSEEEKQKQVSAKARNIPWKTIGLTTMGILLFAGLLLLLLPYAVYRWFAWKANQYIDKNGHMYYNYMASMLYLHQLGFKNYGTTAQQFAEKEIDPAFNTDLTNFIRKYQKIKYSNHHLTDEEMMDLKNHHKKMVAAVRKKIRYGQRVKAFMNPAVTLSFFTQPNILGPSKK